MDETKSIKRSFSPWAPIAASIVVVGVVVVIGFLIRAAMSDSTDKREKQRAIQAGGNQKGPEREPEAKQVDPAVLKEYRLIAELNRKRIREKHEEVKKSLERLQTDVTVWEARLPELLAGNSGKRMAASKIRVDQFGAAIERKRPSASHVRSLRDQLETLFEAVDSAQIEKNSLYSASESIVSEIRRIAEETRIGLDEMDFVKTTVDTLQADSMNEVPADKSLQTVLTELRAERIRQRNEATAKAKLDAYEQGTKVLAEEAAKAEKEITAGRKAVLNAETELELQGIRQRADELLRQRQEAAEAEKKRVEKLNRVAKFEAEYPAMKAYLVPITSHGLTQFKGNYLDLTTTKGPMSLTCLLGNVKKGKDETGYFARQISNSNNDRPLGAFPVYWTGGAGQTPHNFGIWYRVQDFIVEFGDIMVERKLLAP